MAERRRYYDPETKTFLPGARIDIEQYAILKRCSARGGNPAEWQAYLRNNPARPIWLCGANLAGLHLKNPAYQYWTRMHPKKKATLEDRTMIAGLPFVAVIPKAHLEGANLGGARLQGMFFPFGCLQGADLSGANMTGCDFLYARLDHANLAGTRLVRAGLFAACLQHVEIHSTSLKDAELWIADLRNVEFGNTDLRGADLRYAKANSETLLTNCKVDKRTDVTGLPLDAVRCEPGLKQLLECNIRRKAWEVWYSNHRLLRWPLRLFWALSDYGRSTGWILFSFFLFAAAFGAIYYVWALASPPGIVANLSQGDLRPVAPLLVPLRALYFSIVTMTTLGFGDIYAQPQSWAGHICLTLQVLLGYVLLGALVTRFAVLFTAGGPANTYVPRPRKRHLWRTWLYVITHRRNWRERVSRQKPPSI